MPDRSELFADAVHDVWAGFCEGIDGVSHEPLRQWESGDGNVAEANVTYTRQDGGAVTVSHRPGAAVRLTLRGAARPARVART